MRVLRHIAFLVLYALAATGSSAADARPNIVAIVTDDQGQWAVGAYGNRDIHTPHLDRIAREGALFENAFTCTPVCSPSRATYFTGRWPTQLGIADWISPEEGAAGIGVRAPTWPALLQQAGYRTALVGKWHLGTLPEFHPTRHGFDRFVGFLGGGNTPMNPTLEIGGHERQLKGPLPDRLTDHALEFVRESSRTDEPFLLCLHFRAPHLPYGPVPDEDRAHYKNVDPQVPRGRGLDHEDVKRDTLAYYASISSIDRNVGRLLAALDELKLADNTLVLFTSDHGYNLGRHLVDTKGNAQWMAGGVRGPKRPNMWDTSIRVPLLARWPQVIESGRRIAATVANLDLYRTMASIARVKLPDDCQADGIDFSPALRGETLPDRPTLFGQYDLHNGGLAFMRMIRTNEYKFVRHYRTDQLDELYDLRADPEEERNLLRGKVTPESEAIRARLEGELVDWQRSIADPLTPE